MSEIVRETSEYVEMSDSITLCVVKDGKDAVTYGVQVTPLLDWLGGGQTDPGIQIQFTRTTGATVETFTNVTKLGGLVQVYVDGVYHADATDYINRGNDKIVFSHFPIDNTSTGKTIGTASTIGIELLVNSTVVATASYANGKQGTDGKGALEIICDPETIVLNTNDNGLVTDYTNTRAALMCLRDGKEVDVTYEIGYNDTVNCEATVNNNGIVTITKVTTQEVAVDGNTVSVSSTSGSVTVSVTETATGVTYTKTVPFTVNLARYTGGFEADKKKLQSQYSLLTNNGSITSLTEYKSQILQTAKEISLKVSEKSVGRRNMLVGSACRKYGDGFTYMSSSQTQYYDGYPTEQIEINSGIDGVNCIHCRTKQTGTDSYYLSGFRWNGDSPQGNIKLERGKNYVLSFYAKTHTPNDIVFFAEVLYQGSNIDTTRPYGYNGPTGYSTPFSASEADKWELFTVKLSVPSDAPYEYVEICIFARATGYSFVDGYICKPMLEEGEEYNGWTLSEQDYDYVGGNLLDGTGTLTKTGNVEALVEKTVKQGGYNNESASVEATLSPTAANNDFLQYSTTKMGLKAGEDYTLSFYARSSGKGILECYLYPSTGGIMTESSHEKIDGVWNPNDGGLRTPITPTTEWKRYWVHWRPSVKDPQYVLFRLLRPGTDKGSYNSSTSYNVGDVVLYGGTYYVCRKAGSGSTLGAPGSSSYWEAPGFSIEIARPKLEVGATMTEWTEKRADMVDKRALLATGIDIENKKITATADKFVVQNNSGDQTFSIDKDGNIVGAGNASFKGTITGSTINGSTFVSTSSEGKSTTKIEGGQITTNNISATGGNISFFRFDNAGMYSGKIEEDGRIYSGLGMSMNNLSVSGNNNRRISSVFLGNGRIDSRYTNSDNYIVPRLGIPNLGNTFYNYIKLERIGSGPFSYENSSEHAALGIETQGDFCLAALGGPSQFAGMCFASNSGGTFTGDKQHTFYLCSGSTFTMPKDPPDGMLIVVIHTGSDITFNGNGKKFRFGKDYGYTAKSVNNGEWALFYYDGIYWNAVMMNLNPW